MTQVAVETLAGEIREYLRLAQSGEKVVVTDEGRPVAVLASIDERDELRKIWDLVDAGEANWKGGKPKGSARPVKVRGKSVSKMVLEDRR
jgi:prevent-host-death family protein